MKKGKETYKFAPVFRPTNIQVIVLDDDIQYNANILSVEYDGKGRIVVSVRYR